MPETPAHRRAKKRAAGPGGRTEVPLRGKQRLDALTKGGGREPKFLYGASSASMPSPKAVDELRRSNVAVRPQGCMLQPNA